MSSLTRFLPKKCSFVPKHQKLNANPSQIKLPIIMRGRLFLFILILVLPILHGCSKEANNDTNKTPKVATQAKFWIGSDLGCGTITVICNGVTKTIKGYYTSEPECGGSNTATFDLNAGTYTYTASCNSLKWSGNITVVDGTCNGFKLNANGGSVTTNGNNNTATVTTPSTFFLSSQDYTVNSNGAYWTQQFTISQSTTFVFRFASQYLAQAAIILPGELSNFQKNLSFTGYGLFDKKVGTQSVTLNAGTYYVAIRNANSGANKWSMELDYPITLPTSDKATFLDNYATGAKSFSSAGKLWQAFSIQTGYRYFLDGCNVNCDVRIISANQLSAFQNNQSYQYYTSYTGGNGADPGLFEISLPTGDYYLVASSSAAGAIVYTLERWKLK